MTDPANRPPMSSMWTKDEAIDRMARHSGRPVELLTILAGLIENSGIVRFRKPVPKATVWVQGADGAAHQVEVDEVVRAMTGAGYQLYRPNQFSTPIKGDVRAANDRAAARHTGL